MDDIISQAEIDGVVAELGPLLAADANEAVTLLAQKSPKVLRLFSALCVENLRLRGVLARIRNLVSEKEETELC